MATSGPSLRQAGSRVQGAPGHQTHPGIPRPSASGTILHIEIGFCGFFLPLPPLVQLKFIFLYAKLLLLNNRLPREKDGEGLSRDLCIVRSQQAFPDVRH